ncbi:uncharacterized protein [Euphorbia lathyris]
MNQIGCYGRFFLAHELKFGKERVQRWRSALAEIAGFCGWDVPNHRSESKLVRIIVDKLSHYLKCPSPNSGNQLVPLSCAVKPMDFYSYEGLDNIGIARICGMDGMARTTIARVVYDAVVNNEKWGNGRFRELVCEIPKECTRYIWDIDTVINAIRKKMVHKKVLLLVDHVDTLEQVASLVRKHAHGHDLVVPNIRIIVSATTPNKTILNALDISFHILETTEPNLFLDIACFVMEMDDSHVTRIIRSLVSTNLCANNGMKVLINKTSINIEEPTSLDMLLDVGGTGDSSKSSDSCWKIKNKRTYGSVDVKSGNRQIQKHSIAETEAGSAIDRLQSVHKFVKDSRSTTTPNVSGDVAAKSKGVSMCNSRKINEAEKFRFPNSLATIRGEFINGEKRVAWSSDNAINECSSAFPQPYGCSLDSEMLFSSKATDRKLQYFVPEILNGKKIVRVPDDVIAEGIKQCELCLVGQLLGKCSELRIVLNEANELWGKEGRIQVTKTKNQLYIFKFPNETVRDLVLESGPWYIENKQLVLRMWQPNMQLSELDNSKIPVWVKLTGIPMEYMTKKGVSYIASALGKPFYTTTADTSCLDFVKVCVEVSMEDDIMDIITVMAHHGQELRVKVEYLWMPEKCVTCKEFGHSFLECTNFVKND